MLVLYLEFLQITNNMGFLGVNPPHAKTAAWTSSMGTDEALQRSMGNHRKPWLIPWVFPQKWGYPKIDGLEGKLLLKWIFFLGTLILGNLQVSLAKTLKFGEFTSTYGDFRSTKIDVYQPKIYDDTK